MYLANPTTEQLLSRARQGDQRALGDLFQTYFQRLYNIVRFRMDARIKRRVDPADIVQETFLEASKRFPQYIESSEMSFFSWLRFLAKQRLLQVHRFHLMAQGRDAAKETHSMATGESPCTLSSIATNYSCPSLQAIRDETRLQVMQALNALDETDRQVLTLRHYEQLGNGTIAMMLGISKTAASNRYIRAARRLKQAFADNK